MLNGINTLKNITDININIVECKCINLNQGIYEMTNININIVECK